MRVIVKSKSLPLSNTFKRDLESRLKRMHRKASESIQTICVSFADLNGPKGGKDKQCKLIVNLKGIPEILIVAKKDSVEKAFFEALKRANNTLSKRLKRQHHFSRQPVYSEAIEMAT